MGFRNFVTFYVLVDRTPTGGKPRSMGGGVLGHLGLGWLLAVREIPGPGRKHNFPVLGALLGKNSGRPQSFSPKVRNFFTFSVLADRTPTGGTSRNSGGLGHLGLGRPLARTTRSWNPCKGSALCLGRPLHPRRPAARAAYPENAAPAYPTDTHPLRYSTPQGRYLGR